MPLLLPDFVSSISLVAARRQTRRPGDDGIERLARRSPGLPRLHVSASHFRPPYADSFVDDGGDERMFFAALTKPILVPQRPPRGLSELAVSAIPCDRLKALRKKTLPLIPSN